MLLKMSFHLAGIRSTERNEKILTLLFFFRFACGTSGVWLLIHKVLFTLQEHKATKTDETHFPHQINKSRLRSQKTIPILQKFVLQSNSTIAEPVPELSKNILLME